MGYNDRITKPVLVLVPLIVCACNTGPVTVAHTLKVVAPPPPAKGWIKPALGDIGFTIMLPEGWEADTIREKKKDKDAKPKDLSQALLGGWSDKDTGFMATGQGDPSGKEALYMLVGIRSQKDHGTTVDRDIADMAESLNNFGVTISDVKRTTVELPIGKAEKVQYKTKGLFFEDTTETFFIVDGDSHYEFTFSTMGTDEVALPGDAVMTTFRPDWMSKPGSDNPGK